MSQLTQFVIFFNDSVGNIIPGSRHFFYDAGTTTTKAVYSDQALTTPIVQPVLADSAGILPQIWLENGAYRWVGQDENAIQIFDRDNINASEAVVISSAPFVFKNDNDLANMLLANGTSVNLEIDQMAFTQGSVLQNDDGGRQFLILSSNLGDGILLTNGLYANPQANFTSISDVDQKIFDHNSDNSAHPFILQKITDDIADHNADNSAHPFILQKITDDIEAHNTSGTAHNDIRLAVDEINLNSLRSFSAKVEMAANDFENTTTSADNISFSPTGTVFTNPGKVTMSWVDFINVRGISLTAAGTNPVILTDSTGGSPTGVVGKATSSVNINVYDVAGALVDQDFYVTIYYIGPPI